MDTGPMVAYLDARDPFHSEVADFLDGFSGRLATTGAVVTEAMHLVAADSRGPRLFADWLSSSGAEIHDLSRPMELQQAVELMERYANLPMDFADATLLLLAEELGARDLVTLDRRGFGAYRTRDGQAMTLVLDLR